MSLPNVVSRADWLAARKELLMREKQATRARDELNAARRRLPMVLIDKDYVFEGPDGKASLAGLFEGRRQLVIYHFMFGPDWDAGCPSCSGFADQVCHLAHLNATETTFAAVAVSGQRLGPIAHGPPRMRTIRTGNETIAVPPPRPEQGWLVGCPPNAYVAGKPNPGNRHFSARARLLRERDAPKLVTCSCRGKSTSRGIRGGAQELVRAVSATHPRSCQ
jgi:Bacterial protein of unknown function (DUF899)